MFTQALNNIYVINLKRCFDRRQHIVDEFKRVGIKDTDYTFFDAVDSNSEEVLNMMESNFVHKFPPCFRCGMDKCNCSNNILTDCQIGNWCSFINCMKEIDEKNYDGLVMICEDDIKFTNRGVNILNKILDEGNIKRMRNIGEKPILLRVGSMLNNKHSVKGPPKFVKVNSLSNPAFIINVHFARSFLKHLNKINCTSDTYIQIRLPKIDKNVFDFTIIPQPIYELSTGGGRLFKSTIHPKGNDKRVGYVKQIKYFKFLCIGHPRCGTGSVSHYLSQMGYNIGHENMKIDGVSSWLLTVGNCVYPWGNIALRENFYFKNIIHVVRNPKTAIASILLENRHCKDNLSYKFRKFHIEKEFGDVGLLDVKDVIGVKGEKEYVPSISDVEMSILSFVYWNKLCEKMLEESQLKYGGCNVVVCKIEEAMKDLERFNIRGVKVDAKKFNSNKLFCGLHYDKPVISKETYDGVGDSVKELLNEFCLKYGYNKVESF